MENKIDVYKRQGMADIAHIVGHLALPEKVKEDVLAVYGLIAQAESRAHGAPVEQIHFCLLYTSYPHHEKTSGTTQRKKGKLACASSKSLWKRAAA